MKSATAREIYVFELALEQVFERPFEDMALEAQQTGQCDRRDLWCMGRQIVIDMARLAKGEITQICIPQRLPYRGEFNLPTT